MRLKMSILKCVDDELSKLSVELANPLACWKFGKPTPASRLTGITSIYIIGTRKVCII